MPRGCAAAATSPRGAIAHVCQSFPCPLLSPYPHGPVCEEPGFPISSAHLDSRESDCCPRFPRCFRRRFVPLSRRLPGAAPRHTSPAWPFPAPLRTLRHRPFRCRAATLRPPRSRRRSAPSSPFRSPCWPPASSVRQSGCADLPRGVSYLCLLQFRSSHVFISACFVDRVCRCPFVRPILSFPAEYIDMLKGRHPKHSYYGGADYTCQHRGAIFWYYEHVQSQNTRHCGSEAICEF